MNDVIASIISGVAAIIVAELSLRRALQKADLETARIRQSYEDRLNALEKFQAQNEMLLTKLNGIENTIISMQKDIQYIMENNK